MSRLLHAQSVSTIFANLRHGLATPPRSTGVMSDCANKHRHAFRSGFIRSENNSQQIRPDRSSWSGNDGQQKLRRVVYGRPRKPNLVLATDVKDQIYEYWCMRLSKELILRRQKRLSQESISPVQCSDRSSAGCNKVEKVVLPRPRPTFLESAVLVCPPMDVKSPLLERLFRGGCADEEGGYFLCTPIECTEEGGYSNHTQFVTGFLEWNTGYFFDPPCYNSNL